MLSTKNSAISRVCATCAKVPSVTPLCENTKNRYLGLLFSILSLDTLAQVAQTTCSSFNGCFSPDVPTLQFLTIFQDV